MSTGSELIKNGPTVPVILVGPRGTVVTRALIDTGSEVSSADVHLLQQVGAPQTGTVQIQTVAGVSTVPVYAAALQMVDGKPLLDGGILGDSLPGDVQVLIGRDVMAHARFTFDGPLGAWSLDSRSADGLSAWTIGEGILVGNVLTVGVALLIGALLRKKG
jgi:predicted aspartyl protease